MSSCRCTPHDPRRHLFLFPYHPLGGRSVWPCLPILGSSTWYCWVINPAQTAGLGTLESLGVAHSMEHQCGLRGTGHQLWDLGRGKGEGKGLALSQQGDILRAEVMCGLWAMASWAGVSCWATGSWHPQKVKIGVDRSLPRPGKAVSSSTHLGHLGDTV